jgi:hypothetical protein
MATVSSYGAGRRAFARRPVMPSARCSMRRDGAFVGTLVQADAARRVPRCWRPAIGVRRAPSARPQRGLRRFVGRDCATRHLGPLFTNGEFGDRCALLRAAGRGRSGTSWRHAAACEPYNRCRATAMDGEAVLKTHVEPHHRNFGQPRCRACATSRRHRPYLHDGSCRHRWWHTPTDDRRPDGGRSCSRCADASQRRHGRVPADAPVLVTRNGARPRRARALEKATTPLRRTRFGEPGRRMTCANSQPRGRSTLYRAE